jgi:hypothetical protein
LKNLEILLNASSCQELFAQLVDGVIVFSAKNQIIFKNKAFDLLNEDFKKSIIEEASIGASPATSVFWRTDKAIKKVDLNPGFAYIIAPPTIDNSIA